MPYSEVTLTGTHQTPDKQPASGVIEIIPSVPQIVDREGDVVLSGRVKIKLDETGSYSVNLPATDDPTLNPTGFGYTVVAKLHHGHLKPVSFPLPAAEPLVDIADVTTVDPSTFVPDANYVTPAELDAAVAGVVVDTSGLASAADVDALDTRVVTVEGEVASKVDQTGADALVATLAGDPASETGQVLAATIGTEVAAKSPVAGFVMDEVTETVTTGVHPIGSIDGIAYGRHSTTGGLYKSTDDGTTWTLVTSAVGPYGIHKLGDGEVLVNGYSTLKKSSGWAANPATATWTTVATANGTSSFIDSNVATYGNIVLAAEYAVPRTDARYVKVSTDNGATFTNVRDLNTMFPADVALTHWHAVAIDHFHNAATPRLWVSHGDGPRGVYYSDNLGSTWTEYGPTNTWQPMPMMATEYGIVTSTDQNNPDGVWLIPRDLSERVLLAAIPAAYWSGSLLGFGTAATRGPDGTVYMFFRADQQAHFTEERKALVFATDGKRANIVYETKQGATLGGTGAIAFEGLPAITSGGYLLGSYGKAGTRYNVKGRIRRGSKSARQADPGNALTGTSADRSSIGIGYGVASRNRSVMIGALAGLGMTSTHEGVVLVGEETLAPGTRSVAVGYKASSQFHSVAIGSDAVAGSECISIGSGVTTVGRTGCVSIGRTSAVVGGDNQVAVGYNARAEVGSSTAVGSGAKAGNTATSALAGTAVGLNATATGDRSTALGATTTVTHQRSVALGHGTTSTNEYQVQVGPRHFESAEVATEPGAPAANGARWYVKDNGAGKTQLCVRFATGAVQILATEP